MFYKANERLGGKTMNRKIRSFLIIITLILIGSLFIGLPLRNFTKVRASNRMTASLTPSPWSQQGFNETNNAFNPTISTINTQNIVSISSLWSNSIASSFNSEAPVVDNGRVYVEQGADLYGLNETTGNIEWHINMLTYSSSAYAAVPPELANGKLYIVTQDNVLRVFDANDDTKPQLWSASGVGVGITITDNVVYTGTQTTTFSFGNIAAFDASTGNKLWSQTAPCDTTYSRSAIDVQLGIGFFGCRFDYKIFAFYLSDGTMVWNTPVDAPVGDLTSSMVIANNLLYLAGGPSKQTYNLGAFNEQTGSLVWSQEVGNNSIDSLPVIVNGTLYVEYSILNGINGSEAITGLNTTTGTTVWTQNITGSPHYTENERLAVANGVVYAGAGNLFAFDATTGTQLLNLTPSSNTGFESDPVIADEKIFEWTENFTTRVYTLEAFSPPNITPRGKLFLFIQGINSTLSSSDAKNNIIPTNQFSFGQSNGIYQTLLAAYPSAQFRMFSYNGADSNGTPTGYQCQNTFTQHLSVYVSRLLSQITNYLNKNPNTDVYLIGHSMGGTVALGLLTYFKINGFPTINGGKIAGVVSLDSPLGGTPNDLLLSYYFTKKHFQGACPALLPKNKPALPVNSLNDLFNIFHSTPTTPHGSMESIGLVLYGSDFSNQEVVATAASNNAPVLTVGNLLDFTYDPAACPTPPGITDFGSTQWVADQGTSSGIYGRVFPDTSGLETCTNLKQQIAVNHFDVLTNAIVQEGLQEFFNGQTPSALTVAPSGH